MIHFYCVDCGRKFQVKDEFAGRSTRCPACKAPLQVPQPDRKHVSIPVARLVVGDQDTTPVDQRVGALSSATVTYVGGSDRSVADLIARHAQERGHYLIDREIARGGMGAVLRGIDRDIRREIALKVMLDDTDALKKLRFVEEAQITGQLEHPNIVPVHELGVDEQRRPFFTMKLVKGRSLDEILKHLASDPKAESEWPLSRLLTILVNVCHALGYAHSRHVIHRDLKPANVMVGDFGEVYVMDWGLAKVLDAPAPAVQPLIVPTPALAGYLASPAPAEQSASASDTARISTSRQEEADLTRDGSILGTPAFMAPEQALGQIHAIEQRTDIYALGGLLYAVLTLQPPVEKGGGQAAVLSRVAQGEIRKPEERAPGRVIPLELSAVAMKALAKEPRDRYPSVEAFRRDLELFQTGHSVSARRDTFRQQAWKLIKRNRGASIASAAALLVLLVVTGYFLKVNYDARVQAEQARKKSEDNYTAFQDAVKKSVPAFVRSAQLAAEQGDFDEARRQIEAALAADPAHADARLLKGQLLIVAQDFAAATKELEQYLKARPRDARSQRLLRLCREARPDDVDRLLPIATVLVEQEAPAMVHGLLGKHGKNSNEARQTLLTMYRARIEKAWPGRGGQLTIDARGLHLSFHNYHDLTDLSPLKGMPLTTLQCSLTPVTDLSPLKGMPLTSLECYVTGVSDLSPLKGAPLTWLKCSATRVADLSPLKGLPLTALDCNGTGVRDLTPLQGMSLTTLNCYATPVSDLTPLQEMPLTVLFCANSEVTDLTPLRGLKLREFHFSPNKITRGIDIVRSMPSLQTIGTSWGNTSWPAAEFWALYDKGEFSK